MAQSELPSGTVTLLFTDIEGSTKLLDELGAERYSQALAEHRRVMREAFEQRGGVEIGTEGDSFFVVFPTAPGAVEAARAAQTDLSVPVRMGGHPHGHAAYHRRGLRRLGRAQGGADRGRR